MFKIIYRDCTSPDNKLNVVKVNGVYQLYGALSVLCAEDKMGTIEVIDVEIEKTKEK